MKTGMARVIVALVALTTLFATRPAAAQVAKPHKRDLALPAVWVAVPAQKRLEALKVAQIDGLRQLAERVYGFQLSSRATVQNFVLTSASIRGRLEAFLVGAAQTEKEEYTEDGIVQVVYGVKLRDVVEIIKSEVSVSADGDLKRLYEVSVENQDKLIEALGNGALEGSKGLDMVRAKRAAEMDAFAEMAQRVKGVKIFGNTTVGKLCLEDDVVATSVCALLKGIKPIDITYNSDGSCEVTVQLKLRDVIETVETTVTLTKKGLGTRRDETRTISRDEVDRVLTATGHGAPKAVLEALPASAAAAASNEGVLREEKTILRRVIETGTPVVE